MCALSPVVKQFPQPRTPGLGGETVKHKLKLISIKIYYLLGSGFARPASSGSALSDVAAPAAVQLTGHPVTATRTAAIKSGFHSTHALWVGRIHCLLLNSFFFLFSTSQTLLFQCHKTHTLPDPWSLDLEGSFASSYVD